MQGVGCCIDYNLWVSGVVEVPVADSHITAGTQDELVLVHQADVHSVHTVLRRLLSHSIKLLFTLIYHHHRLFRQNGSRYHECGDLEIMIRVRTQCDCDKHYYFFRSVWCIIIILDNYSVVPHFGLEQQPATLKQTGHIIHRILNF